MHGNAPNKFWLASVTMAASRCRPRRAATSTSVLTLFWLLGAGKCTTGTAALAGTTVAKPTPRQLALLQQPVTTMGHFGISTFAGEDNPCNAKGCPPVAVFRPRIRSPATQCDISQWITAARALGSRQICLTAHHGAGFTLWNSSLTNYSAARSPYHADLLAQFASECRRQNISICYYFDAGDAFDAMGGATAAVLFAKQRGWLYEVLRNPAYGPVDRLWIDGWSDAADSFWGSSGGGTRLVRTLSPGSLLVPGPDGCRAGGSGSFGVYPQLYSCAGRNGSLKSIFAVRETDITIQTVLDWNSSSGSNSGATLPRVVGQEWFWRAGLNASLSASELWHYYLGTVGRGSNLIVNMPPSTACEIPAHYLSVARAFGQAVESSFGSESALAATTHLTVAHCNELTVTVALPPTQQEFDSVLIKEDLSHGARILNYSLSVMLDQTWVSVPPPDDPSFPGARGCKGGSIGMQLIDLLPAEYSRPSEVSAVRVQCKAAIEDGQPVRLASVSVHQTKPPP